MACAEFINIQKTLTLSLPPNSTNGYIDATLLLTIDDIASQTYPILGTLKVPYVRDITPPIVISSPPITQTLSINGNTNYSQSFPLKIYYPQSNPTTFNVPTELDVTIGDCIYSFDCLLEFDINISNIQTCSKTFKAGCTNINFVEFDETAEIDNGSCLTPRNVYGCTNPLASNYDENALINDGSCVFLSGCTNPLALNYEELAVIDDGSCNCGDISIELDIFSGQSLCFSGNCDVIYNFDLLKRIDCNAFIEYVASTDKTPLEVLNDLSVDFEVYSLFDTSGSVVSGCGELIDYNQSGYTFELEQTQRLWSFDSLSSATTLGFYESSGDCKTLYDLLALEYEQLCTFDASIFTEKWMEHKISINRTLQNKILKTVLKFNGFRFKSCFLLDNIKVEKICQNIVEDCILIPKRFGFDLSRVVDDKKSWVFQELEHSRLYGGLFNREAQYEAANESLVFNSKEIDFHINPSKFIYLDTLDYFAQQKMVATPYYKLSDTVVLLESINPKNRQVSKWYPRLQSYIDAYKYPQECYPSKELFYPFGKEVEETIGYTWFDVATQFIPATTIYGGNAYFYANMPYHQNIHKYKQFGIILGLSGSCSTSAELDCNYIPATCYGVNYPELIDIFASADTICVNTGTSVCVGYVGNEPVFGGSLVEYYVSGQNIIIGDTIGFEDYECTTPHIVYGCTDPNSPNYNPNATIDDGSCAYLPIELQVYYNCNELGQGVISIDVQGGSPPYTILGTQDGAVLPNGSSFIVQAVDSVGFLSNIVSGTIVCPFPCDLVLIQAGVSYTCIVDEFGNNTGLATLHINPFGGTPPYNILGASDGQIVSDGDLLTIQIIDSNNCYMNEEVQISINCPTPSFSCEDLHPRIDAEINFLRYPFAQDFPTKANYTYVYVVSNLPNGVSVQSVDTIISSNSGVATGSLNNSSLSPTAAYAFSINYEPDPAPNNGVNINVQYSITLSNGCVYAYGFSFNGTNPNASSPPILLYSHTHTF